MSNLNRFPVPNSTAPFWHSENDNFRTYRSSAELPKEVDLVIVGSGFSGSSLAYYLSKSDKPPKTLMLEARNICSGATGRNGGHCKPEYYRYYEGFEKKYGMKLTAEIGNFEFENLMQLKKLIEDEKIECDFVLTRAYNVHVTDTYEHHKEILLKAMRNPYNKLAGDIAYFEGEKAVTMSKVSDAKLLVSFTSGHLWPFKLIKGLLKIALSRNFLNLQSNTPVTNIETLPDGKYLVITPRGKVLATKVVLATNAYTSGLAPAYEDLIVPVKGTCSHIRTTEQKAPYLDNTYAIIRERSEHEYLINRPDGTIVVGGAKQVYQADLVSWYGNTDDSTLFNDKGNGTAHDYYKSFMQDTYSTWENVKTTVEHLWTGIMGYSADSLPFTGEVPGEPNKFISAGFTGHGMPRVLLCSKAISECILEGKKIEETGIPETFMLNQKRLDTTVNEILDYVGYDKYTKEEIERASKPSTKL
ncbi:hypothetical protein CANARDRAFT_7860 [[Candida] arabinofermentans NRRL YB-2248]|uniref:FAD dependent oxidoreductase domain-containing protein n=1 Tax=[Candida] arabinofermentans NRRL YB-2248 TaxID=983967 RepID=A0A1E4T0D2_9ASCO|nr:hypothetical protein CANARDRAFT_7860 [[Candida] arabinofermentans NRRL YB-2248]